jgi:hypothetical protein
MGAWHHEGRNVTFDFFVFSFPNAERKILLMEL